MRPERSVETEATQLGHLLALRSSGVPLAQDDVSQAVIEARRGAQLASNEREGGVWHAIGEVGAAALGAWGASADPATTSCRVCSRAVDDRFCSKVGRSLAEGDIEGAVDAAIAFDAAAYPTPSDHLIGISIGLTQMLGSAAGRFAIEARYGNASLDAIDL